MRSGYSNTNVHSMYLRTLWMASVANLVSKLVKETITFAASITHFWGLDARDDRQIPVERPPTWSCERRLGPRSTSHGSSSVPAPRLNLQSAAFAWRPGVQQPLVGKKSCGGDQVRGPCRPCRGGWRTCRCRQASWQRKRKKSLG